MKPPEAVARPPRASHLHLAVLAGVLAVGAAVRFSYVLGQDFPLNDGGLFYGMTQALQRARYALPVYAPYNGARLPFAYPPLGFYLAGLLADLGRWPLLEAFRLLPAAISIVTIAAFYRLSRALLGPGLAATLAALAFALLPGSYTWQIMGGGVTRAPGFLFAILALEQAHRLYTRRQARWALGTILCAGGAVLSHPAMAWLTAVSGALLFLAYGRNRAGVGASLLVAGGTAAVSAPWWATVILRHGLAPLIAAARSPEPALVGLASLVTLRLTGEPAFPILGAAALLGAAINLARRRFLLPGWLAVLFLLDPRSAATNATLPLALLAGIGMAEGLLPALQGSGWPGPGGGDGRRGRSRLAAAITGIAFVYALGGALTGGFGALQGLSREEREAMRWVAGNTPEDGTFAVVTGDRAWGADRMSEWFPILAGRRSVATVQGTEWLEGFAGRTRRYTQLQRCAGQGVECLEVWAKEEGVDYDYLYVARRPAVGGGDPFTPCCGGLQEALRRDPRYRVVYEGAGAAVYRREAAGAAVGEGQRNRGGGKG